MLGFCSVEEAGVPPSKVHNHEVAHEDLSVKLTVPDKHTSVVSAEKLAIKTGATAIVPIQLAIPRSPTIVVLPFVRSTVRNVFSSDKEVSVARYMVWFSVQESIPCAGPAA